MPLLQSLGAVARRYGDLGFVSFGGPGVHVIILRERFVQKLAWLDETTFLDLFSLGNALPGPGSTQLAFSIAVVCHGVLPGLLAFLLWSLPGAAGMAGLGFGVAHIPDTLPPIVLALLTGLNAAAVGLIALAAVQLANGAATDRLTTLLLWLSAAFGICYHAPWMYPTLIAAGGLATVAWDFRRQWLLAPLRRRRAAGRDAAAAATAAAADGVELDYMGATPRPQSALSAHSSKHGRTSVGGASNGAANGAGVANGASGADGAANGLPSASPFPSPSADHLPPADGRATPRRRRETDAASPETAVEPAAPAAFAPASRLKVVPTPVALALLAAFVLFLTVPLATRAGLQNAGRAVPRALDFFANMIIAGTIIFGGGPVVIPLLRDYVVVEGWVSSRDFLLIFAILQAFPGPNFNFAVALGVLALPWAPALGAVAGYVGIFAPGILLKLALLPLYSSWRERALVRSVIRGLNATASGLVFTAVWQLFLVGYIYQPATGPQAGQALSGPLTADPFWAAVATGAFVACKTFAAPPWLAVLAGGAAGLAWYGVQVSK